MFLSMEASSTRRSPTQESIPLAPRLASGIEQHLEPLLTSINPDIVSVLLSHSVTAGLLDAAERFDAPKCDEGTRVSMQRSMKNFVEDGGPFSSPAIYWLHGPAGVGKSALAQTLALSLKDEGALAASFFFSRTAPGRNDGNQLIVTLAYQLAVNFPPLQPFILQAVKKDPAVFTASNAAKMQSLIIGPINNWQKSYYKRTRFLRWLQRVVNSSPKVSHPRLILVDGLDECNNPSIQRDILMCLGHATRRLSLPFRFVVASRPESHILTTFELDPVFQGPDGVKLVTKNLGDDEDADEQITTFLLKEFAEIRRTHPIRDYLPQKWPLPNQIAQLVSKSSQGFIYPATVIRYIKMPNNRPDECLERILGLSEIPARDKPYEPLDVLYRYILGSVPDENKESIHQIFHFLVVPVHLAGLVTVTPKMIEQYFDYKPGHVQHVLGDLLCIVALSGRDAPIRVLHASLPDFLLDRARSGHLCLDKGAVHATIAATLPFALASIDSGQLQHFRFILFLEHMVWGTLVPDTLSYRKLVGVDFRPHIRSVHTAKMAIGSRILNPYLECVEFVTAYLVVLMKQGAQVADIRRLIAQLKADILEISVFAATLHSTGRELFSCMIPSFRNWAKSASGRHQFISNLFVSDGHLERPDIYAEIYELYFLLVIGVFDVLEGGTSANASPANDPQSGQQQLSMTLSYIVCTLLGVLLYNYDDDLYAEDLIQLIVHLLNMSLPHLHYSAPLKDLLRDLERTACLRARRQGSWMRQLARPVTDYLMRVYSEMPQSPGSRDWVEIQRLRDIWNPYLR